MAAAARKGVKQRMAKRTAVPAEYATALGTTLVRDVTDHGDGAALRIGKDVWSKTEIAIELGVVHVRSARILTAECKKLGVRNTGDLYERTSPYSFAGKGVGVYTLYVMFRAFRAKGFDPNAWYAKGQESAIVSFFALKHREQQAEKRTRDDQAQRKRRTRSRRHAADVDKFLSTAGT
jgi:hypothetical protein